MPDLCFPKSQVLSAIPGVIHGFGDRLHPTPNPHWEGAPQWHQVHGAQFAEVTQPQQQCEKVDALYTQTPGLPIGVRTADCVPILAATLDGTKVAAIHAGWRGTHAGITKAVFEKLLTLAPAHQWRAAVGPCNQACCYEVSEELAEDFRTCFPNFENMVPTHRRLNLSGLNEHLLRGLGIPEVEVLPHCTQCDHRFFSYRRGDEGRQVSIIESTVGLPDSES